MEVNRDTGLEPGETQREYLSPGSSPASWFTSSAPIHTGWWYVHLCSAFFSSPMSFSAFYAGPLSAVMVHLDQLFPDWPKRSLPQRLLRFLIKKIYFKTILLNSDLVIVQSKVNATKPAMLTEYLFCWNWNSCKRLFRFLTWSHYDCSEILFLTFDSHFRNEFGSLSQRIDEVKM